MEVLPLDWRLKDMCVSKKNSEGYDDPTAYEALTRIEQEQRACVPLGLSSTSALPIPEM